MANQILPIIPREKEIIHMACRRGCGSNQAFLVMKLPVPFLQGGGDIFIYRCVGCGKKCQIKR